MNGIFEIRTLSDPRLLSAVRSATGRIALVAGFESKQIEQIKLAVDEICTNIIRHTYRADPGQEMILDYRLIENGLEIHIQDFGQKVDPRLLERPRPSGLKPGGLGLSLVRSALDEFEFGLPSPVGNRYRLVKYRGDEEDL
ncbi:MAG: ATP-binding protein [Deltaproteobacteria bacterium]|nr:ATP-binding protein [Deltaproteobacteria bacterium]MBW2122543.1 ATP-binding protein [Deltaproteobacteria bacterium]